VLIASGTIERKMNIPGEDEFYGKGVSYCAVCDGALYTNKPMMVIGGGNSALQEALYLTRFSDRVYLSHRRNEFRGEEHLANQVRNHPRIHLLLRRIPAEIKGDKAVKQMILKNLDTNELETYNVDVVFPFIGLDAATDFIKELGILDSNGYVSVDHDLQTTIPGIFAAGDVIEKHLRQILTASSDGAIAANAAIKYIDNLK
jgi:thioredoxin reductase (NADPH)